MQLDQHAGAVPGVGLGAVPGARRGPGAGQGLGRCIVQGLGGAARLGAGPFVIRGAVLRQEPRAVPRVVQGRQENELKGGQEPHSVMLCRDHRKTNETEDRSRIPAISGKRIKGGQEPHSVLMRRGHKKHTGTKTGAAFPRLSMQLDQHAGAGPGVGLGAVLGAKRWAGAGHGPGRGLVQGLGGAARLGAGPGAVSGAVLRHGPRPGLGMFGDDRKTN
jgi:hypothetical protein